MNHDIDLTKFPKINPFYRRALNIWRAMDIRFEGTDINSIKDETICHNKRLLSSNNETFKYFSLANNHTYIPNKIRDLPVTRSITSILILHRGKISDLNRAFWRMQSEKLGKFNENCYAIMVGETCTKLQDIL